jgi:hypothetical protein
MSTHVFPFAGPIDPQCSICGKTRSQIEREARINALVDKIAHAIKTDLRGAGLVLVAGNAMCLPLTPEATDRAVDAMARNVLQVQLLQLQLETLIEEP